MKKIFFYLLLIFALLFVGTLFFKGKSRIIQAEWMSKIGSAKIDAHGICRNVVNSGSRELMVPYNTKGEWCSFLNTSLTNVTITNCQKCSCMGWCCNTTKCEDYNVGSCP
jgi:hypothetical protein